MMTGMVDLPLWIADADLHPVYWNRKMREQFGVSIDDLLSGYGFRNLVKGRFPAASIDRRSVQMGNWQLRFADGKYHPTLSYFRPLWFREEFLGYVGTTLRYDLADQPCTPAALGSIPEICPKFSFDVCGVVLDVVSEVLRSIGPLMSVRSHDDCKDVEEFRDEYVRVMSREFPGSPIPSKDFFRSLRPYPDYNLRLVSELHEEESIRAVYLTKPWTMGAGRQVDFSPMEVRYCAEREGVKMYDIDPSKMPPVLKILGNQAHAHLDDNPEDWVSALFAGVPAFLMTRPWNDWIRSRWRVHSVESMLRMCGVEADRCYSEYDARVMHSL